MFRIEAGNTSRYCDGISRRSFVQMGVAGMAAVGLPQILQAKEASAALGQPKQRHLRDPAVARRRARPHGHVRHEARGPGRIPGHSGTRSAPTCRASRSASCFRARPRWPTSSRSSARCTTTRATILPAATTCSPRAAGPAARTPRASPRRSARSPARSAARGSQACRPTSRCPYAASIGLRPGYFGANYLGLAHNPFETNGDPNSADFKVENIQLANALTIDRLEDRHGLLQAFRPLAARRGHLGRDGDDGSLRAQRLRHGGRRSGPQGVRPEQRRPAATRDRYGRTSWGQSTLLARRLVEAGSTWVTVHMGGWDHHWDLKSGYGKLPAAGRHAASRPVHRPARARPARQGAGDAVRRVQPHAADEQRRQRRARRSMGTPGRDHWGNAMFCLMGGGGIQGRPHRRLDQSPGRSAQGPPARTAATSTPRSTTCWASTRRPTSSTTPAAPCRRSIGGEVIAELL